MIWGWYSAGSAGYWFPVQHAGPADKHSTACTRLQAKIPMIYVIRYTSLNWFGTQEIEGAIGNSAPLKWHEKLWENSLRCQGRCCRTLECFADKRCGPDFVLLHWLCMWPLPKFYAHWLGAIISRVHCLARHTGGAEESNHSLVDVKDIVTYYIFYAFLCCDICCWYLLLIFVVAWCCMCGSLYFDGALLWPW